MWNQSEPAAATPTEKRSFSQTCILLSRYLKDNKVALGDLNLGGKPGQFKPTLMNQLPEIPMVKSTPRNQPYQCPETMNLFPQYADSSAKPFGATEGQQKAAQMAISYAGQVAVFDYLPAEKANEILLLAEKESNSQAFAPQTACASRIPNNQIESNATVPPSPNMDSNLMQDGIRWRFPQARRCSLHRFLERRKVPSLSRPSNSVPAKLVSFKPQDEMPCLSSADNKWASHKPVKVALEPSELASSIPGYDSRSWLSLAIGRGHSSA
ncbi:hypothetical protein SAY86_002163 [Trapa natans]|uniref:Protein TIFY n=1 Tax=Trapa natans TaxID=22666 RepID=A0AAN7LJT1_TRANT|nr:hypothetical protein SAY86_002163 [Trapa natans]